MQGITNGARGARSVAIAYATPGAAHITRPIPSVTYLAGAAHPTHPTHPTHPAHPTEGAR
ncbi:MAG: hypothetical protein LBH13_03935 [Cellulomonadaceae bacterium]|nr:hypothetical protein [Cellulomonadaceae bacterium]